MTSITSTDHLDRWRKLVRRNVSSFILHRSHGNGRRRGSGSGNRSARTDRIAGSDFAHASSRPHRDAPAKPWRIGPMDVSGFLDGYYSYNANGPSTDSNGKVNDLYNFNDKTNQFNLSAAKLTLNHDPGLLGARMDFFYGRTSHLINTSKQLEFVEQAYLSTKPPAMKGFEADFGKFVTSAGAEVIEAKDNWNYSRSILFAWAIPYYHFGLRTSMPVSKRKRSGCSWCAAGTM